MNALRVILDMALPLFLKTFFILQHEVKMLKEFYGNVKDCKRASTDSLDESDKRAS